MRFRHLGHSWFAEGVRACVSVSVCMGARPCVHAPVRGCVSREGW